MQFTFSNTKESWLDKGYEFFVVLSLVMYIFGHSTDFGTLPFPDKVFYIPCGVSLVLAVLNQNYWSFNKSDSLFLLFYLITFIYSSLFIGLETEDMITSIIGFLVFRYLSHINLKNVFRLLTYMAPFVVGFHYLFSSPLSLVEGYRYGGFQGDPNCFSFAMNILIYVCGFTINYSDKAIEKILAIVTIVGIVPLILAAASRAGIAIMATLIIYILWDTLKKKRALSILILVVFLVYGVKVFNKLETQLNTVSIRFDDTMETGDDYRVAEFSIVPSVLNAHPEYMPLGIGYSQSLYAHKRFPREYYHEGRAHNTYMSVLLEEGIVGFVLFLMFIISIGKTAFRNKYFIDGRYRIVLYFSSLFFIFTIYSLPFLPFWFAINIVANEYDITTNEEDFLENEYDIVEDEL